MYIQIYAYVYIIYHAPSSTCQRRKFMDKPWVKLPVLIFSTSSFLRDPWSTLDCRAQDLGVFFAGPMEPGMPAPPPSTHFATPWAWTMPHFDSRSKENQADQAARYRGKVMMERASLSKKKWPGSEFLVHKGKSKDILFLLVHILYIHIYI